MSETHSAERTLTIFCRKRGEFWTVMFGPGWVPTRLIAFSDADFETAPLLLDFDYLDHCFHRESLSYHSRTSARGDVEIRASGDAAKALATWLSSALASGMAPRT